MRSVMDGRKRSQLILMRTATMVLVAYVPLWSFAQFADGEPLAAVEPPSQASVVQTDDGGQANEETSTVLPDEASEPSTDVSVATQEPASSSENEDSLLAKHQVEVAQLGGIQPGASRTEDADAEWGEPTKVVQDNGVEQRLYSVEPFDQVVATAEDGVITSIVVNFDEPFSPDDVAERLALDEFRPVVVHDATGKPLGQAYPERGVLFGFDPEASEPLVVQIILEPIDSQTFLARAENQQIARPQASLDDLEVAEYLSPDAAKRHDLRAAILFRVGRVEEAMRAIDKALDSDATNPEFLVTRATVAMELSDYDLAAEDLEHALELASPEDLVRARVIFQQGNLHVYGANRDLKQAIEFHLKAIKLAEPLLADENLAVQRDAEELLIEAHLAVAYDVAYGNWRRQESVVPMWLDRATELADATSSGRLRLRRQITISSGAVRALLGLGGKLDHRGYTLQALRAAKQLLVNSVDSLNEHALQMTMGRLLSDSLRIAQLRGDADEALDNGTVAADYFELAAESLADQPRFAFYESQLMFRIGSVHALQKQDHSVAVEYFDRAFPLLKKALPHTPPSEVGQQGEALVSMAVSYWEIEDRDLAVRLTSAGAQLMEQAVDAGLMEFEALEVPYTNLASMHRHLGNDEEATDFEHLATRPDERDVR